MPVLQGSVSLDDLPQRIPIFPLVGVLMLPGSQLPLNMFEPRYLEMTRDALAGHRIIGMIQPRDATSTAHEPEVYPVGCAGKIVKFAETEDGRYLITLLGLCRFKVIEELDRTTGYRQTIVDFTGFHDDLKPMDDSDVDRGRLLCALRSYLDFAGMPADWEAIDRAPTGPLINSLAMICPFEPGEKQALLEAANLTERSKVLTTLMEMAHLEHSSAAGASDGEPPLQ